ncbi:MAG: septum formation initiator family protein [Lachnospiraceae bacterium]|jgi:cell division protein FtsB
MRFTGKQKRLILVIMILVIAAIVCVIMGVQIAKLNSRNRQLEARKERLEQLLAEEERRRVELEDEAIYVKTRKYIEEKAKSIGYVYPDEIIFRKDD